MGGSTEKRKRAQHPKKAQNKRNDSDTRRTPKLDGYRGKRSKEIKPKKKKQNTQPAAAYQEYSHFRNSEKICTNAFPQMGLKTHKDRADDDYKERAQIIQKIPSVAPVRVGAVWVRDTGVHKERIRGRQARP